MSYPSTLQWRHNGRDSVSNHQPHDCLLNRLFRRWSKKTSKLRVTGLSAGNSPGPVNSPHKWPVTRKMFPFDDIMEAFIDGVDWCANVQSNTLWERSLGESIGVTCLYAQSFRRYGYLDTSLLSSCVQIPVTCMTSLKLPVSPWFGGLPLFDRNDTINAQCDGDHHQQSPLALITLPPHRFQTYQLVLYGSSSNLCDLSPYPHTAFRHTNWFSMVPLQTLVITPRAKCRNLCSVVVLYRAYFLATLK